MRRGIGKGLAQLRDNTQTEPVAEAKPAKAAKESKAARAVVPKKATTPAKKAASVKMSSNDLPITSIQANPRQPRTRFDDAALKELADSIRQVGVIQPIVVRPIGNDKFEIIAGERRFRAAQLAGLKSVPTVSRTAGNQQTLELALIENVQREDIGPIEAARAYKQLMDEFDLRQEDVATKVGKSRTTIANTVRLLQLPGRVVEALDEGAITEGQARPLLGLKDDAVRLGLFERIVTRGLSSREVERIVSLVSKAPIAKKKRKGVVDESDPNWKALQQKASEVLGAPVKLEGSERGGTITIRFSSEDDLVRIMDQLGIQL